MKLTNKYNLPQTFVNILQRPTYTKGGANISATELINSPRIVQLKRLFDDELEQDVSDQIWSIFGTAIHAVLEHGKDRNHLVEERLHAVLDGWSISGAIDLQVIEDDGIIVNDYKTTSVWAVMNEKVEWEQQLNIYAWLVETVKGVLVKSLNITALIKDWKRREAETREGYPETSIKEIPITIWSYEERTEFIKARIREHSSALFAAETGSEMPECTPEQMWEKQTSYAIKKVGNKRATAVLETRDEAEVKLTELGKGYAIEVRLGERTRCTHYCQVNKFCTQYESYLQGYDT